MPIQVNEDLSTGTADTAHVVLEGATYDDVAHPSAKNAAVQHAAKELGISKPAISKMNPPYSVI